MITATSDRVTGPRLRELFLEYFHSHGHAILPSASLVPENDPTVLFTTAGMHPLVPYLRGSLAHPLGPRLANVQKCLRTGDLEEVGDATHLTFFEMLGNWSLGDYFKEEAIAMSFEFLVSDRWLKIPIDRLAVTCFSGEGSIPKDEASAAFWRKHGIRRERIFFFGKKENWWGPPGKTGPCGPDTEMFFDTRIGPVGATPNDGSGRFVEIWNNVFMTYEQTAEGVLQPLTQRNVDTGMGLERTVATLNGFRSVYETDLFTPVLNVVLTAALAPDERQLRIAADHLRAAVFVLADPRGIIPSNVEQGYVLRRLIRRGLRALEVLGMPDGIAGLVLKGVADAVAETYGAVYPEVRERKDGITEQLDQEHAKYRGIRLRAEDELKRWQQRGQTRIGGREAFDLYQSRGFHPDLLQSLGASLGITVDLAGFDEELAKHQVTSRAGVAQRFTGGLADHTVRTVRLHTATHLLHAALRRLLGTHVEQRGSNITSLRLRFDFSHPRAVTREELRAVEGLVNEQITRDLPVTRVTMSLEDAKASGVLGFFEEKYGKMVSVYSVGDFSREMCGGPHVTRSGEIGRFRILKEEGLATGVRRIRATVS